MSAAQNLKPRPGWQPGQSGNPGGKPKLPDELRAIRCLSQDEMARYVAKYARMAPHELDELVETRAVPMLELTIARIFQESETKGDFARLGFLLDRAGLKPKPVEASDSESEAMEEIRRLTTTELISLVKEQLPVLEKP